MRFAGQRVLITGSTRNTGFGMAMRFAEEGAAVAINGTTAEGVAKAAAEIRDATGAKVVEAPADLGTLEGVEGLFAAVDAGLGGLDVLVNNAVHLGLGPTFVDVSDELLMEVINVNVLGYYRCGQRAAKRMSEQGTGGAIVNLGSNTSERAIRARSAYCASKGAIDGLTRAMALDLAPHGIRVNCVAPGYIFTERWEALDEDVASRRRRNVPLGEPSSAVDIAEAVMFMASPAAGNVTGSRLVVDGGCTVQLMPVDVGG